jgi:uncharacterized protein (DUF4415 family)
MTGKANVLGSDLAKVDATTDEDIARHMLEDDTPEWTDEMFDRAEHRIGDKVVRRGRPPLDTPKQQITLRLDQDVLDHFRAGGAGWQSRINAVLREAIKQTG